jgi:hypothetical protein
MANYEDLKYSGLTGSATLSNVVDASVQNNSGTRQSFILSEDMVSGDIAQLTDNGQIEKISSGESYILASIDVNIDASVLHNGYASATIYQHPVISTRSIVIYTGSSSKEMFIADYDESTTSYNLSTPTVITGSTLNDYLTLTWDKVNPSKFIMTGNVWVTVEGRMLSVFAGEIVGDGLTISAMSRLTASTYTFNQPMISHHNITGVYITGKYVSGTYYVVIFKVNADMTVTFGNVRGDYSHSYYHTGHGVVWDTIRNDSFIMFWTLGNGVNMYTSGKMYMRRMHVYSEVNHYDVNGTYQVTSERGALLLMPTSVPGKYIGRAGGGKWAIIDWQTYTDTRSILLTTVSDEFGNDLGGEAIVVDPVSDDFIVYYDDSVTGDQKISYCSVQSDNTIVYRSTIVVDIGDVSAPYTNISSFAFTSTGAICLLEGGGTYNSISTIAGGNTAFTSNLNARLIVGLLQEDALAGAQGNVVSFGIDTTHSGLAIGQIYYVNNAGALTTDSTDAVKVGFSINTNTIRLEF